MRPTLWSTTTVLILPVVSTGSKESMLYSELIVIRKYERICFHVHGLRVCIMVDGWSVKMEKWQVPIGQSISLVTFIVPVSGSSDFRD